MNELYSNSDGTVQFLEFTALFGGQQFLAGHTLTSTSGGTTHVFTVPTNLPGDTTGRRFLVGTQGFAALGVVTPDYVVPNGFFFPGGGTINWGEGVVVWVHGPLPSGALSLNGDGSTSVNSPTNFVGASGSIPPPALDFAVSPTALDFGGQSMGTTSPPQTVTLTNTGGGTVAISNVLASAQFAQTNNCTTLAPAASCTISVTFSPAVMDGGINVAFPVTGILSIRSNGSGNLNTAPLAGTAEKSLVTHYYRAILNRVPDATGKAFWEGEAVRLGGLGADLREAYYVMAGYFFNSAEYQSFGKTDTQFVTDLYNTFFNRPPDGGGLAFWTGQISGGLPREVVLFSFMFSTEFQSFTTGLFGNVAARPEVNLVMDFFRGILNRLPDSTAYTFWVGQLKTAQCQGAGAVYQKVNDISFAFIFGSEYANRFRNNTQYVTDEYYSFLRRGGDTAGVQFWISQLDTAAKDRNTERADFIASPEFGARVNAVIAAGCVP